MKTEIKNPSEIWFIACIAAENALPVESRALIEKADALSREWRAAGIEKPVPEALSAARAAANSDALASVAMHIRRLGNEAAFAEWKARQ